MPSCVGYCVGWVFIRGTRTHGYVHSVEMTCDGDGDGDGDLETDGGGDSRVVR